MHFSMKMRNGSVVGKNAISDTQFLTLEFYFSNNGVKNRNGFYFWPKRGFFLANVFAVVICLW